MQWWQALVLWIAVKVGAKEWAAKKAVDYILHVRGKAESHSLRLSRLGGVDIPARHEKRIIRSSAPIYKPGHVLRIDGKMFHITRLLSQSPKEVLYEAETR